MGIELGYLQFYKVAYTFNEKGYNLTTIGKDYTSLHRSSQVVLNRCQSKSRRIFATAILEASNKTTINPLIAEENCQSKLKTLLKFKKAGIKIPKTMYVSPNAWEKIGGLEFRDNFKTIYDLIKSEFNEEMVVIKPDAGTHGKGVQLAESESALMNILSSIEQGITNPSGVMVQELIPKWFYDLRIIIKRRGGSHQNAKRTH